MELVAVYNQFHQVLLGFIRSKVNNHHDAEDILQNVFIKVATGLGEINRHDKLQGWIYAITRNAIIDYYRSRKGKSKLEIEDNITDRFSDEEYNDTTKGLDCCLIDFVKQLPEAYRDILIDVEFNGLKQKDLVEKYGLAYPTIRSRVQRGREKLKQILLECCHVQWDNRGNILDVQARAACSKNDAGDCEN